MRNHLRLCFLSMLVVFLTANDAFAQIGRPRCGNPHCRSPRCRAPQCSGCQDYSCPGCQGSAPMPYGVPQPARPVQPGEQPGQPFDSSDPGFRQPPLTNDMATPSELQLNLAAAPGIARGDAVGQRNTTIGDFFGGGGVIFGQTWGNASNEFDIAMPLAGGDRRFKITEQTSPIPMDRMFFNYHVFTNAVGDANGNEIDLNRYVFGLEKTFWNGMASLEIRVPFEGGVSSNQTQMIRSPIQNRGTEFGNISLVPKFLLLREPGFALSTGLGIAMPTASDAVLESGSVRVEFENESWQLQPFIGVYRCCGRSWCIFYTQADFTTVGDTVSSFDNSAMVDRGIYNNQNLLHFDLSAGYWLYQNNRRRMRGIAGIGELHYTTTLNDPDSVTAGRPSNGDVLTNPYGSLNSLNLTAGIRLFVGDNNTVTFSGAAPLRKGDGSDLFDGEISLQINRGY